MSNKIRLALLVVCSIAVFIAIHTQIPARGQEQAIEQLLFIKDGDIILLDPETGTQKKVIFGRGYYSFEISKDGKWILAIRKSRETSWRAYLEMINIETGNYIEYGEIDDSYMLYPLLSPDSEKILFHPANDEDVKTKIIDRSGKVLFEYPIHTLHPHWGNNNRSIYFFEYVQEEDIYLEFKKYELENKETSIIYSFSTDDESDNRITPISAYYQENSPLFAIWSYELPANKGELIFLDLDGKEEPARKNVYACMVFDGIGDWSPEGNIFAYSEPTQGRYSNGQAINIYHHNTDGGYIRHIGQPGLINPRWSPDGSKIAFTNVNGSRGIANSKTGTIIYGPTQSSGNEASRFPGDCRVGGTQNASDELDANWSPSSRWLVAFNKYAFNLIDLSIGEEQEYQKSTNPRWVPVEGVEQFSINIEIPTQDVTSEPEGVKNSGQLMYLNGGDIYALDLSSMESRQITTSTKFDGFDMSRNGRWIAAYTENDEGRLTSISIVDTISGESKIIGQPNIFSQFRPKISINGLVAYENLAESISTIIVDSDGEKMAEIPYLIRDIIWSLDGEDLYFVNDGLYRYSVTSHSYEQIHDLVLTDSNQHDHYISPAAIYFQKNSEWFSIWDYESEGWGLIDIISAEGEIIQLDGLDSEFGSGEPLGDWSSDGDTFLFGTAHPWEDFNGPIYTYNINEKVLKKIIDPGGINPRWSPDDKQIAFVTQKGGLWLIESGNEVPKVLIEDAPEYLLYEYPGFVGSYGPYATKEFEPFWSPNGDWLVYTYPEGFYLIDMVNGRYEWFERYTNPRWVDDTQALTERPPAITDLRIEPTIIESYDHPFILRWTDPKIPDSMERTISEYDVRYSDSTFELIDWEEANKVVYNPEPIEPGKVHELYFLDLPLEPGIARYFGVKIRYENSEWSEVSNKATFIDSGLRSNPDGYQFTNTHQKGSYDFSEDQYIKMIGEEVCIFRSVTNGRCTYGLAIIPSYYFYEVNKKLDENYVCLGMASASLHYYFHEEEFKFQYPTAQSVFSLEHSENNVREGIAYNQVTQYFNPVNAERKKQRETSTVSDTFNRLINSLLDKDPNKYVIFIENVSRGLSHAVTPIGMTNENNDWWKIWVYENNDVERKIRFIEINPEAEKWKYKEDVGLISDGNPHSLFLIPLEFIYGYQEFVLYENLDNLMVILTGNFNITIENKQGQKIEYLDGVHINKIPGAYVDPHTSSYGNSFSQPSYHLPRGSEYNLLISSTEEINNVKGSVSIYGPGFAMGIPEITGRNGNVHVLSISADETSIGLKPGNTQTISFFIARESEDFAQDTKIQDVELIGGSTFEFTEMNQSNRIVINNQNSDTQYTMNITRYSQGSEYNITQENISIGKGELHTIDLENFNEDGDFQINANSGEELDKNTTSNKEMLGANSILILGIGFVVFGLIILIIGSFLLIRVVRRYS